MQLPVQPPLEPMLGRLARELPRDGFLYEPKWDGFRCLAFRDGAELDLRSRHGRPLARYFPEIVEDITAMSPPGFVLDGEIVVASESGFDFAALMARLHPAASRVDRLREETPAAYVAFDLVALGDRDLRATPFAERRVELENLLAEIPSALRLTPSTPEPDVAAAWLDRFQGGGIDGVMAKARDLPYRSGARAMVKVKPERTADCVVGGFRVFAGEPAVASLLLGLHDDSDQLQHVGVVSSFAGQAQEELFERLRPLVVPLRGHPWEHGFLLGGGPMGRLKGAAGGWTPDMELDWTPVAPELVCEVAYDQVDGRRLRHPARLRRWRPDLDPRSCRLDQLAPASANPAELLSEADRAGR